MLNAKRICNASCTLGHGQKMNRVKQIRFSNAIFAHNAVYFWDEVKLSLLIRFKLLDL